MDQNVAIRLSDVSKTFKIFEKNNGSIRDKVFNIFSGNSMRKIKALDDINLEIQKGEFFGVIGHNGSGKSTLLKIILGAYPPDKGGNIQVNGRIIRLALGMGFDPQLSARDNVYLNASLLGLTFKEIGKKFEEMIAFAELEDFVDTKVKYYSSGMRSRLAFAVAVHVDADILLIDEFFGGVGDIAFKKKSEQVFKDRLLTGRTIVFVSHNLNTIEKFCERVAVIQQGKLVAQGTPKEVIPLYKEKFKKRTV